MNQAEKLKTIDEKMKALQDKRKKVEEDILNERLKLFKKLEIDTIPLDILVGSLLETVDAVQKNKHITKQWEEKGKTFFEAEKKKRGEKNAKPFRPSSKAPKTDQAHDSKDQ